VTSPRIADRLDAHAAQLEAQASALRAEAAQIREGQGVSEILTRSTWPADSPCTFRVALEAGRRGELPISKAGRTPTIRRSDLDAWIAARAVAPRSVAAVSEDNGPDLVRERGERQAHREAVG
jgi:hypothetical protein